MKKPTKKRKAPNVKKQPVFCYVSELRPLDRCIGPLTKQELCILARNPFIEMRPSSCPQLTVPCYQVATGHLYLLAPGEIVQVTHRGGAK